MAEKQIVAAIDCGTNSIRLLIAQANFENQQLLPIYTDNIIVRLGQGVDKTGKFADAAIERTFVALDNYARQIKKFKANKVRFIATSATRDASNREKFIEGVKERVGVAPEIISGDEEAALSFSGALLGLSPEEKAPYLLSDLGGGSTELVLGDQDGVKQEHSMDVGCVRITERCLKSDPPTKEEIGEGIKVIDAAIDEALAKVDIKDALSYIGVAGSTTTIASYAMGMTSYDAEKLHGAKVDFDEVYEAAETILSLSTHQRATLSVISSGRIDVIGAGALVLMRLIKRISKETDGKVSQLIISETDILHGIALSCVLD
ncbi:MAG: Ppx/GppA phosphatase family protein [Micrococcaceae bacterium]